VACSRSVGYFARVQESFFNGSWHLDRDFRESFLKANANKDFICTQFAEVLRDLIRAVAVRDDPSGPIVRATEQWSSVASLLERCEEKISTREMFSNAVEVLRLPAREDGDGVDRAVIAAARRGISFYMEASCTDNAAKGRTSKRERDFLSAIEQIEGARERRRQRWDARAK
jgi:hypothetical protein